MATLSTPNILFLYQNDTMQISTRQYGFIMTCTLANGGGVHKYVFSCFLRVVQLSALLIIYRNLLKSIHQGLL